MPTSNAAQLSLSHLAPQLKAGRDGILFAGESAPLSYPEEGNRAYFAVEDESFWFVHRNRCIAAVCEHFVPERFIADVGGGNGVVSQFLLANGFRTLLVEPGMEGCVNARKRGLEVVCGSLEGAGFVPHSLPAIGCFDVVEHIEDAQGFLNSCRTALAEDGKLILTVPAFKSLWSHEDELAGHYRRYTLETLQRAVERAGFEPLYATYFFSLLSPVMLLVRALPYRLGKRKAKVNPAALSRDHNSRAVKILGRLMSWEVAQMKEQRRIPVGTSCLLVARVRR